MLSGFAVRIINFYQKHISVFLPKSCRFEPTCSEYAKDSIKIHGFLKGSWRAIKRIGKCHPFSGKSGYDPVQ